MMFCCCCCRRRLSPLARWRAITIALLFRRVQQRLFTLGFTFLKVLKKEAAERDEQRDELTGHHAALKTRLHDLGVQLHKAKKSV